MQFIDLKKQYELHRDEIDARMRRVLDHGAFIMGPEIDELEKGLAAYVGVKHAITVASGTDSLEIALRALGIGPGDEVVTVPFTWISSSEVIGLVGARPVFVDIDPATYNIDVAKIEAAITPRTKAIMPVSLFGQMPDCDAINAIAARHNVVVIEDAAQSFGATQRGRKSCAVTRISSTSFFPAKPLGCYGDGGALFTDDDTLAQAAREIRVHGQSQRYTHTRLGVGGRMDTLQCAIVLAKLERFDWEIAQRLAIGERYQQALAGLPVQRLAVREDRDCVWAQFTLQVADREGVTARLNAAGVPTAIHYPKPLHLQPAYAQRCRMPAPLPHAEAAAARVLSLPMSADLQPSQQDLVIAALRAALP